MLNPATETRFEKAVRKAAKRHRQRILNACAAYAHSLTFCIKDGVMTRAEADVWFAKLEALAAEPTTTTQEMAEMQQRIEAAATEGYHRKTAGEKAGPNLRSDLN